MTKCLKMKSLKELKVTLNPEDYMGKVALNIVFLSALTNLHLKKIVNFTGEGNHTNCEVMIFGLWKVQVVPDYKVTDLFRQHAVCSSHFQLSFKLYSTSV